MRIRELNHSVYQVQYHVVWGTKYRRKILKDYVKVELIKSLKKIQKKYPTWYYHRLNTDKDHVHLILEIPPSDSLAFCIQQLKSISSADLRKRFRFIKDMSNEGGVWSVGYFVSTIGLNEQQIRKYVDRQGNLDLGKDITAEFS
jgi:putative transposase